MHARLSVPNVRAARTCRVIATKFAVIFHNFAHQLFGNRLCDGDNHSSASPVSTLSTRPVQVDILRRSRRSVHRWHRSDKCNSVDCDGASSSRCSAVRRAPTAIPVGGGRITRHSGVNQLSEHGERIVVPERRKSQIVRYPSNDQIRNWAGGSPRGRSTLPYRPAGATSMISRCPVCATG